MAYLEDGDPSSFTALCDRDLVIHSASLWRVGGPPPDPSGNETLAAVVEQYRSLFPATRFSLVEIATVDGELSFRWRGDGTHRPSGRAVILSGTGRMRIEKERVEEIWLAADLYDLMLQLDRICPSPGRATGRSAELNRSAADVLRRALMREPAGDLPRDAVLHASVAVYADLGKGFATRELRFEGEDQLDGMLDFLREQFASVIELRLDDGVSQGSTTTFRGTIRFTAGASRQRYRLILSVASPRDRVTELWVQVSPPPTLKECLT
jgi:hypothetical protein